MQRIVTSFVLVCVAAAAVVLGCCTLSCCTKAGAGSHGGGNAVIVGSVVDAANGKPVADARVEGPGGRSTRSDERGRFELSGFEIGTTGEVKASTSDGRTAVVSLRRLAAERLEIVLHVKKP
jgi:hypothetical protein